MRRFLERVSREQAVRLLTADLKCLPAETVATELADGRIIAQAVFAAHPSPHYRASAMDGVAVRAACTFEASKEAPCVLRAIERTSDETPRDGEAACLPVDTGDTIPDWADAVIRIENLRSVEGGFEIGSAVPPGKDIRRIGEDIDEATRIVPRAHRIGAADIGALLATGVAQVLVVRRPRVASMATGGEIIEPGEAPQPGRVIEYNSRVLAAMVRDWGGEARYLGRVGDDRAELSARIRRAVDEHDVVCVMAGSSAGSKDFTVDVLDECGELIVHGVDIVPGRPVAAAMVGGKPVFAIPGYPVSAYVVYRELVAPVLATLQGAAAAAPQSLPCWVRRKVASKLGAEEFLRVCLREDMGRWIAVPLPRGAGSIGSVATADAFLRIAPGCEGLEAGAAAEAELLRSLASIRASLVCAGAPDQTSAEIEDRLRACHPLLRINHLALSDADALDSVGRGEADFVLVRAEGVAGRMEKAQAAATALGKVCVFEDLGCVGMTGTYLVARMDFGARAGGAALLALLRADA